MKKEINPKYFSDVCYSLQCSDAKSAIKYIDEKTVVRATWRTKPRSSHSREEMVVTFGCPNYLERKFIVKCKKSGGSFPIKKIQFRPYPIKKKNK